MRGIFYARPSDIITASATVALTAGAANAAFPLVNLYDLNPAKPFKATSGGCTITFTYGGATTLQAIAIILHNLVGATVALTNNAGMASQAITIPANSADGLSVDPFKDLRAVASNSATVWTLTITGASANVAIGEVLLCASLRQFEVAREVTRGDRIPAKRDVTSFGVTLVYPLGVRNHRVAALTLLETERANLLTLFHGALGERRGFLVIPDLLVNDAYYMRFASDDFPWVHLTDEKTDLTMAFEDVGRGPGV